MAKNKEIIKKNEQIKFNLWIQNTNNNNKKNPQPPILINPLTVYIPWLASIGIVIVCLLLLFIILIVKGERNGKKKLK